MPEKRFDEAKLYHFTKWFDDMMVNNELLIEIHHPECGYVKQEEKAAEDPDIESGGVAYDCDCGLKGLEMAFEMLYFQFSEVSRGR